MNAYAFYVPPCSHLHKFFSHEISTAESLSHGDQSCQFFISHLLKCTQKTSLEKHLRNIDNSYF